MEAPQVSHQLAKFGDHRHCGSRDIMALACHVILQNQWPKGQVTLWMGVHQGKSLSSRVL